MSTKFVIWKPKKKTEKTAMANYGNEWLVVKYGTLFDRDSLLFICPINPNERKDLRWISKDQVISERWEINPL